MEVKLLTSITSKQILEKLGELGLEVSPEELLRHVSYTFSVSGVSRALTHQLVRHRMASYTQQSQRYVKISELREVAVIPHSIEGDSNAKKRYTTALDECQRAYHELLASGIPEEDARFLLPNATPTTIIVTMTGRYLMHFFGLRCCLRAQWEIRELADRMLVAVRRLEPELFRRAGPNCYQLGYCPEGRLTCGKMDEVVKRYEKLGYTERR